MLIGTRIDGATIDLDEGSSRLSLAGSPVGAVELREMDALGKVTWASNEWRDWIHGTAAWEVQQRESRTSRVVVVDAALEFDGETVSINRELAQVRSSVGHRKSLRFPVGALFNIQDREPSPVVSGYLRFVLYGHPGGPMPTVLQLGTDPYAIAYRGKTAEEVAELRESIKTAAQARLAAGNEPVAPAPDLPAPWPAAVAIQSGRVPGGSAQMVCPHCGKQGMVRTKRVTRKAGVSGGKATAAVLTGGLSLLATGLSRKESVTEAHCMNCRNTWHF